MTRGYYCVAAWDIHNRRMVRPLQPSGENWRLDADRSLFRVGSLLDCSPSGRPSQAYPHATEDLPLTRSPTLLEHLDESTTYAFLLPTTARSIRELFGRPLAEDKFVEDGAQCPSLGGVRIRRERTAFEQDAYGKLRFRVHDADDVLYRLPVTCDRLRHFFSSGDDESEPTFGIAEANRWLGASSPRSEIILRIGLARGWGGRKEPGTLAAATSS